MISRKTGVILLLIVTAIVVAPPALMRGVHVLSRQ
jgi:hypothetical protein